MKASTEQQTTESTKFFQGVGLIYGRVEQVESQKLTLTVDLEGNSFKLGYVRYMKKRLRSYLEENPAPMLYLRVYPRFNFVSKEFSFVTMSFYADKPEQSQVNQFLLAGVWQDLPQFHPQPVMSIYRNALRPWESPYKSWTNHLPVAGFDAEPFRYESKESDLSKKKRKFYELVVNFDPQQKEFQFLLLLDSTEEIPPYIKRKIKESKLSPLTIAIKVTKMDFAVLKKTAMKLRESGFFEGKVSGKGVTKESLSNMVQESLTNHPEAVKALESVASIK